MAKRQWGTGSIRKRGQVWWIAYRENGKRHRESAGRDYDATKRKLKEKLARITTGSFVDPHVERIKVADLWEPFHNRQECDGCRGVTHTKRRWQRHVEPFFGSRRVLDVGSGMLDRYVADRRKEGAAPATVNREIAVLRGMFRLGYYSTPQTVRMLPKFPQLREDNVRTGFVEPAQYDQLVAHAKELWLRSLLEIYHTYGWRKREVLALRVKQVDFDAGVIRLEVGSTKNREGREVELTTTIRSLLLECSRGKRPDDFLFTREDGKPVRDFRKAWTNLCDAAGVSGTLIHDMRRTAARNLRRAGVAEGVIMRIGGWKTRTVFERYNIVSQADIREALGKLEKSRVDENGHKVGHNQPASGQQTTNPRLN